MSTTDHVGAPAAPRRTLDISGTARVPFGRLVSVEWRKMLDTRGGFWLMLITGLLLALTIGLVLLVVALDENASISANDISQILIIPLSLLLPVFPILAVTSEWSQRTGLVTFSLEPHRLRVLLAKLCAVILFAVATIAFAVVLGAITNPVGAALGGYDVRWDLDVSTLALTVVSQLVYFLMAFGLAMLLLSSPTAIAVFYVVAIMLPFMVYSILYGFFEWARDLIPWIDLSFAFMPFLETSNDLVGVDWARLVVAVTIWVVLPTVLGIRRVLASEPK
ncbi:ABC transporter permease [Nocardioides pantholopis]|uniref:ABC transporter permease n=1 Tax=Nocardioides pantholopis TaxID=2483798 RepID=UPI000F09110A|nr:ABC transporter permease [Nocardioides pantholopis]